jgi:hypothetical protein
MISYGYRPRAWEADTIRPKSGGKQRLFHDISLLVTKCNEDRLYLNRKTNPRTITEVETDLMFRRFILA